MLKSFYELLIVAAIGTCLLVSIYGRCLAQTSPKTAATITTEDARIYSTPASTYFEVQFRDVPLKQ